MVSPITKIGHDVLHSTLRSLGYAGATTEHTDWMRSRDNAALLVQFIDQRLEQSLIHGLFSPIQNQILRVRELNFLFDWGIPDEAFSEVEHSVPKWPESRLVVVTLVPYLPANDKMGAVGRTFQGLWKAAIIAQSANQRWEGYEKADQDSLRLLKGIEHPATERPVLRWEVIDLGCNCSHNRKLSDVRSPATSPHAGILAAAALHPQWIRSMDGKNVPHVWLPGYQISVSSPGASPWAGVPLLAFRYDSQKIVLEYDWDHDCCPKWAAPEFFGEQSPEIYVS